MPIDPLIDDVAGAVLDGDSVDWVDVEARTDATATLVVKHLQVLSIVAGMHRQKAPDPPRERAREERWGHLRLLDRIGRGAYGEVFRAWDPRLDREVALKLLPAPAASDGAAPAFIEEGRLLARVRHPGVVTIHGAEQIGDRVGLWMEYVRGRTLAEILEDGESFTPEDVTRIGLELSSAVDAVHAAGVIHRDIKAHNVVRADDGRVMLMDFGTGLEAAAAAATPAGTPLYLAPELFAGGPATVRSDIYSLGVLLFHLLTGTYPVIGRSLRDVRLAHERGERTALAEKRPDLPRRVTRAIERAIDLQPERRYESAAALGAALQAAQRGTRPWWIAGVAAAAALFILWVGQIGRADTGTNRSLAEIARGPAASWWPWRGNPRAIAVLPFQSSGTIADGDLMAEGLAHETTSTLATVQGLEVRSAASSFAFRGKPRDMSAVHRDLGVEFVVEGETFGSEDHVRVIAKLVRVPEDVITWTQTFEPRGKNILGVQYELALAIATHLGLELGGRQQQHVIEPRLQAKFLMARAVAAKQGPRFSVEATKLFEEIIAEAPAYAPAWAGVASALGARVRMSPDAESDFLPRMTEAAHEAYRLDPDLAEANAAMGLLMARGLHWSEARDYFAKALSMNPSLTAIHSDAAAFLLLPLGRTDDAMRLLEVARTVDPLSLDVPRTLVLIQLAADKYHDALATARWVLDRDPEYPYAGLWHGRALALLGQTDEALRVFRETRAGKGYFGYVYAVSGLRAEAEELAATAIPAHQLLIYGGLGDKDKAFEALESLFERNPWRAATWMLRPEVAIIRNDPRFAEFRKNRLRIPN
jgi:serine/threonine-protein kinase